LFYLKKGHCKFLFCLLFGAVLSYSFFVGPGLASEDLNVHNWDEYGRSELNDIQWNRPSRKKLSEGLVQISITGQTRNFKLMRLSPVMMVAPLDEKKNYHAEPALQRLATQDGIVFLPDGNFELNLELPPARYRLHVTFENLAKKQLSYLFILEVTANEAKLQRIAKTSHNTNIERFLTYEEILEKADLEASEQTKDLGDRAIRIETYRRKNFIKSGLGLSLMSFSQLIDQPNIRKNFTSFPMPLIQLGVEYSLGRDFYLSGEILHQMSKSPENQIFSIDEEEGRFSWSSQNILGHFTFPFWNRRLEVTSGISRMRLPYFFRSSRRELSLDKISTFSIPIGIQYRHYVSDRDHLSLRLNYYPLNFQKSIFEVSGTSYYQIQVGYTRALTTDWHMMLESVFQKYSTSLVVPDLVDQTFYQSDYSLLSSSLLLKFARVF